MVVEVIAFFTEHGVSIGSALGAIGYSMYSSYKKAKSSSTESSEFDEDSKNKIIMIENRLTDLEDLVGSLKDTQVELKSDADKFKELIEKLEDHIPAWIESSKTLAKHIDKSDKLEATIVEMRENISYIRGVMDLPRKK